MASSGRSTASSHDTRLVSLVPLTAFTEVTAERGHDPLPVLSRQGLDTDLLTDPYALVSADLFLRCVSALRDTLDDPCLGLYAGQHIDLEAYDVLAYHFMALPRLRDAMAAAYRAARQSPHVVQPRFEEGDDEIVAHLAAIPARVPGGPEYGTFTVTITVALLRLLSNEALAPDRVCLTESAPADPTPYDAYFRCPIEFDAPEPRVAFPAAWFDLPNPHANPGLAEVLAPYVEQRLGQLADIGQMSRAVRAEVARRINTARSLSLPEVARALAIGPRALQKRLREEGTRFSDVMDAERREAVLTLLHDPRTSLEDVAQRLGFENVSSLHRAFRRWFGVSPARYRAALLRGDDPPINANK